MLALTGITHCRKCSTPLNYDEFGICKECKREEKERIEEEERKEKEKIEKEEKEEKERKEKILSIFYNMNEYEKQALQEFIHKIGIKQKRKITINKIKELEKELEENTCKKDNNKKIYKKWITDI